MLRRKYGSSKMIKVVIFDLDDTLISEKAYIESGYQHIAKLLSSRVSKDYAEIYQMLMDLFNESPLLVFNRLLDLLGMPYKESDIFELVEVYRNHVPAVDFFNDVLPCLKNLKNKKMKTGIITDGYASTQRHKIKAVQADHLIDKIIITDELGREYWKPHSLAYEMMKEKFGVEFYEMIYVGDNVKKDFISANYLNIVTVMIKRPSAIYSTSDYNNDHYSAKYIIKSLEEILNVIHLEKEVTK